MKQRLLFLAYSLLFWLLFFQFARLLFMVYHIRQFIKIPIILWFQSGLHGLRLDISMAAYLSLVPFVLAIFSVFWPNILKITFRIYSLVLLSLLSVLIMVDLELFSAWGFRLDATALQYLSSPKEALISTLSSPLFLLAFLGLCQFGFGWILLKKWIFRFLNLPPVRYWYAPVFVLTAAALVVPIRGGFQLAPINESAVFFSDRSIINQSAINCIWNFGHSLAENSYNSTNPYIYLSSQQAKLIFDSISVDRYGQSFNILKTQKPNIIFIIWESGTAKLQQSYEGHQIVPNLESLKNEGIYFEQCYASGMRTDKGLAAILSGYPAQPTSSILVYPKKSGRLPSIAQSLKTQGYQSCFVYGGEPEFANIKSYLFSSGFDKVIGKNDFEPNQQNSKWGAHDEYSFDKLLTETERSKPPFFNVILTLTSHEPFEIPSKPLLPPDTRERLFVNSHHYTDSCLADFIIKAKKTSWWANTLIVVVADHGHPLPGVGIAQQLPKDFLIPLLLLGGALDTTNLKIKHTISQTDIPNIVLNQLNISDSNFVFGSGNLQKPIYPSAYYSFNNGFGFISDTVFYVHNNTGNRAIYDSNHASQQHINRGKAYLQHSFGDYLLK